MDRARLPRKRAAAPGRGPLPHRRSRPSLRLRLRPGTRPCPPVAAGLHPRPLRMRALLLQPDCAARETLHAALAERGWRVALAGSGVEAAERFRERAFALVVLDAGREGEAAAAGLPRPPRRAPREGRRCSSS